MASNKQQRADLTEDERKMVIGEDDRLDDGLVRETTLDEDYSVGEEFSADGAFSHEFGLSQAGQATASSIDGAVIYQTSDLYHNSMSYTKTAVDLVQLCKKPQFGSFWTQHLSSGLGKLRAMVAAEFGNDACNAGEFVALSVPVDRRKKCRRIKSASEHHRNKQKDWKGEPTKTQLSESSIIPAAEI
jgi:hypothetical protein